jgi:hypothetical protein
MSKISSKKISAGLEALSLDPKQQSYTEEEKKVAMYGEKGQGDYLDDAKRNRRK